MERKTKITKIEKKWTDKKTGEKKSMTIDYAKVADRIQEFWKDNPRGKIETTPTTNDQGQVIFKAYILTDKAEPFSKEATGHTLGTDKEEKNFEKLESLAVGRALALLGYAGSGEIASSEEMEDYVKFKQEKREKFLEDSKLKLEGAKNLEELKTVWACFTGEIKKELEPFKETIKKKYENS